MEVQTNMKKKQKKTMATNNNRFHSFHVYRVQKLD